MFKKLLLEKLKKGSKSYSIITSTIFAEGVIHWVKKN